MSQFQEAYLDSFISTALERHRIYRKKEANTPKPWTTDEVYKNFFFCNLFRQYDKCSKWMIENVIPLGLERWDLIILYRFISTYELYEQIKANCDYTNLEEVKKFLAGKKSDGGKMFNACFIRNPRISGGWAQTYEVPFYTIKSIRDNGEMEKALKSNSLEYMVAWMSQFEGIGGFMGYEYACDFEYTKEFNPVDKYTWANKGPGAQRGMSIVATGTRYAKYSQETWLAMARDLYSIMKAVVHEEFPSEDFSMREVEHWLCEYQKYTKYWSVLRDGNQVKFRKYDGRG